MDTTQKSATPTGSPISKLDDEDLSSFFDDLSPLKTAKSIQTFQPLASLSCTSPPFPSSVFTSPYADSFNGIRFKYINNHSDPWVASNEEVASTGVINDVGEDFGMYLEKSVIQSKNEAFPFFNYGLSPLKTAKSIPSVFTSLFGCSNNNSSDPFEDGVASNEEVASIVVEKEKSLLETEQPQILIDDCNTPEIINDVSEDVGMDSEEMCVKAKSEPSYWETLIDATAELIYGSLNESEDFSCLLNQTSNSEARSSSCLVPSIGDIVRESESGKEIPMSSVLEELNPISPKKKRRKSEQSGEGKSSCKRCNCKRSKCVKLYCECFVAGVYCMDTCSCIDCFNKPISEDIVLASRQQIESRNPLAFAPKVTRSFNAIIKIGDAASKTLASARHKRGCNCKKSNCLKRYCECFQGGVGCSINCRCEGCKNSFGIKDGSAGDENKENETSGENITVKTQQNVELFNYGAPSSTPTLLRQPLAQHHSSSNNRLLPLRSHLHHGAFGSSYNIRKPYMSMLPLSRPETITEDTDEENIIQSPMTNIKGVISPYNKKVSLPHVAFLSEFEKFLS